MNRMHTPHDVEPGNKSSFFDRHPTAARVTLGGLFGLGTGIGGLMLGEYMADNSGPENGWLEVQIVGCEVNEPDSVGVTEMNGKRVFSRVVKADGEVLVGLMTDEVGESSVRDPGSILDRVVTSSELLIMCGDDIFTTADEVTPPDTLTGETILIGHDG